MSSSVLVGDAGGTSTDWRLFSNSTLGKWKLSGYNAVSGDLDHFIQQLKGLPIDFPNTELRIYIAGILTSDSKKTHETSIAKQTACKIIEVYSDSLGAARALCGEEKGYVGILGTGSGLLKYDGQSTKSLVLSLGYLLGDEGSGTYIGKSILRSVLRGEIPDSLTKDFRARFGDDHLVRMYSSANPRDYLSGFVPWVNEMLGDPFIEETVKNCFRDYFEVFIPKGENVKEISFVGSIAYHFSELLKQVAMEKEITVLKILQSPIDELLEYHCKEFAIH